MVSNVAKGLSSGRANIIGRCIGFNQVTSQSIVYSEGQVEINVFPLNKVKIVTPLTRVLRGAILPASLWAEPNISPMILGKLNRNKWQFNNVLDSFLYCLIIFYPSDK